MDRSRSHSSSVGSGASQTITFWTPRFFGLTTQSSVYAPPDLGISLRTGSGSPPYTTRPRMWHQPSGAASGSRAGGASTTRTTGG